MWDQSYDGSSSALGNGGFMSGGGTPGGGAGGEKKRQRANNIVPVRISDVNECHEETLKIEGQEVGMLVIVGQVRSVENTATKTVYKVEDKSGQEVECVHWVDEGQESTHSDVSENMYCRVIGAIRTNQDKRSVMVFKISPIEDMAEVDAHSLDVLYARMKIKQLKDKENSSVFGNQGPSDRLSNSMTGGAFASSTSNQQMSASNSFGGNPKYDMVYKMIVGCERESGMNRDELMQQLKGRGISKQELDAAVDFLSGEGHVYSTIDDDHFKAIDG